MHNRPQNEANATTIENLDAIFDETLDVFEEDEKKSNGTIATEEIRKAAEQSLHSIFPGDLGAKDKLTKELDEKMTELSQAEKALIKKGDTFNTASLQMLSNEISQFDQVLEEEIRPEQIPSQEQIKAQDDQAIGDLYSNFSTMVDELKKKQEQEKEVSKKKSQAQKKDETIGEILQEMMDANSDKEEDTVVTAEDVQKEIEELKRQREKDQKEAKEIQSQRKAVVQELKQHQVNQVVQQPAPAKQVQPAPAKQVQPAPAKQVQPAPAKQVQPAPAKQVQPAPAKQTQAAPKSEVPAKQVQQPASAKQTQPTAAPAQQPKPKITNPNAMAYIQQYERQEAAREKAMFWTAVVGVLLPVISWPFLVMMWKRKEKAPIVKIVATDAEMERVKTQRNEWKRKIMSGTGVQAKIVSPAPDDKNTTQKVCYSRKGEWLVDSAKAERFWLFAHTDVPVTEEAVRQHNQSKLDSVTIVKGLRK